MASVRSDRRMLAEPAADPPAVADLLPDVADRLRALADQAKRLDVADLLGQFEALRVRLWAAATRIPATAGPDPSALLRDAAVAEILSIPVGTVVQLRQRGTLPGVPIGDKYVRTRRRDLDHFVDSLPPTLYSRRHATH